ncbi:hypothetical protein CAUPRSCDRAFT_11501 [Caulochytrium protostelioides]|uniref:Uncharacterized protein n=1 Tax=Caulochytrium protostelioides TaxID=1555241 RepID=A0A4P9WWX0_9FUNG|nr:hypothetical protein CAUPRSCDRAFT_11501 [Caulochytrium protostelioides]
MSPIQKLALHPFTGRYFCVEASPSDAAIMMAEIFLTLSAATRLGISATIAGTMTGEWVDSSETKHVAVMSVCDSTHVLLEPSRHTMMPAGTHKIPLALDFREVIAPGVSMLEVPPTFQCEGGRVAYTLQRQQPSRAGHLPPARHGGVRQRHFGDAAAGPRAALPDEPTRVGVAGAVGRVVRVRGPPPALQC